MRLAVVRQHYAAAGAAERPVEGALNALLERNVAISLYTRAWPQTRLNLIEPVLCDPFHVGALWRDWGFARGACAAIGQARADLVYSLERVLCCDVYHAADGVHAARVEELRRGTSVFGRARLALAPYHRYALGIERRLYASPWLQKVICPSKLVRDEIHERFGLPHAKLPVIYGAVDGDAYSPALRAQREPVRVRLGIDPVASVFLLVTTDDGDAEAEVAFAALARIPAPAHLILATDARRRDHARARAAAHGVGDRVTPVARQSDLRPYHGAADALIAPFLYDPAATTTLAAMACGLPAITSTRSGAAELVREHDGGLVCVARDAAGLAAQMRALLDPQRRERLGANAREAVAALTPDATTLQFVLLFKDLLTASAQAHAAARSAADAKRAARRQAAAARRLQPPSPDPGEPAAPGVSGEPAPEPSAAEPRGPRS